MEKLKYIGYSVVCEEVPDEIAVAINISGCRYRCNGCHSKYLWEYTGNYISDDINNIIGMYDGLITCVCFMGGDQNMTELRELLLLVKKKYHLKTCIYSGCDDFGKFNGLLNDDLIDYLKVGSYKKSLGGLDNVNTNQRMYKIIGKQKTDITYRFRRK
jgi:anaerobic ribonucleoside-triphosphate reductase activating protein